MRLVGLLLVMSTMLAGQQQQQPLPDAAQLEKMAARLTPVHLKVDTSHLSAGDQQAVAKLVEAAKLVNHLYLQQVWSGNLALYQQLQKDTSALGKARLNYFWMNKSPWSELDGQQAFLPGVPPHRPAGANYYPEDMTKEAFESWVKTIPEPQRKQAEGFFSVIRKDDAGKLHVVPYSQAYEADLGQLARLLREAAAATTNASLKKFLTLRAEAFLSNDYYASDLAWMDLDSPVDVTIGPYETYMDEIFGYKAAYEAYVNIRDEAETAKLKFFADHLQDVENNLPIDAKYRNPKLGASAPIVVVNEIVASGDGAHGVRTAAYNLPNDERVIQQKGSKRVMLKNVQEAKFEKTLTPIAKRVLSAKD